MGALRQTVAPAGEPVSLVDAKTQLRLDETVDDSYVTSLITVARQYAEQICWRAFLKQTWKLTLKGFLGEDRLELPERRNFSAPVGYEWSTSDRAYRFFPYLELPMGHLNPTLPIVSVTYYDQTGALQTLDPATYSVDQEHVPGRLWLAPGMQWPMTQERWDSVAITYNVGWDDSSSVPGPLKQALLLHVSQLYENRSPEVIVRGASVPVGLSYDAIISPFRLVRL